MPLTYDGRLVQPGYSQAPSLRDIALSLSRTPRFAGYTRRWWSVLHHSVFVMMLARDLDKRDYPDLHLALLLHDAHEAITGDMASDVKTKDVRNLQRILDERIIAEHWPLGAQAWADLKPFVKEYDRRALHAEAWVLGPPDIIDMSTERYEELFGQRPAHWTLDRDYLARVRHDTNTYVSQPAAGINGPEIMQYLGAVRYLQAVAAEEPTRNLTGRARV